MRQFIVLLKTLFMAACAVIIFGSIAKELRRLEEVPR